MLAPFLAPLPGPGALLLVGGSDPAQDVARVQDGGASVLVGTPGRLSDVFSRAALLSVRRLELLVLDEADRLLSMGFAAAVSALVQRLPKQRRTGLFSATQTEEVEELARAGLRNPVRVTVRDTAAGGAQGRTPSQLQLLYVVLRRDEKLAALARFLGGLSAGKKSIVYFLTCACVDFYASALSGLPQLRGLPLTALHGRMKQSARERALRAYSAAPAGALLCTDVAARGLDIPGVDWVLQFDPPQDPAAFVHRVGRTARMGAAGASVVLLTAAEEPYLDFLKLRSLALSPAPEALFPPLTGEEAAQLLAALRQRSERERELLERGVRAFVSFVRGYKEHACRFIFRLKQLELGQLASSLALLRLPRMPETKRLEDCPDFSPSPVPPDEVPFKDRKREKARQARLLADAASAEAEAQAKALRREAELAERRRAAKLAPAKAPTASKRRLEQTRADADEMAGEWRLLKKLRKGKISERDFDLATGLGEELEQEAPRARKAPRPKDRQNTRC